MMKIKKNLMFKNDLSFLSQEEDWLDGIETMTITKPLTTIQVIATITATATTTATTTTTMATVTIVTNLTTTMTTTTKVISFIIRQIPAEYNMPVDLSLAFKPLSFKNLSGFFYFFNCTLLHEIYII